MVHGSSELQGDPRPVDVSGVTGAQTSEWDAWFGEANPSTEDPMFTDPMNYDFSLQPGSPLAERAHELPSFELDAQTRSDLMA